jgi:hypothetical protein
MNSTHTRVIFYLGGGSLTEENQWPPPSKPSSRKAARAPTLHQDTPIPKHIEPHPQKSFMDEGVGFALGMLDSYLAK